MKASIKHYLKRLRKKFSTCSRKNSQKLLKWLKWFCFFVDQSVTADIRDIRNIRSIVKRIIPAQNEKKLEFLIADNFSKSLTPLFESFNREYHSLFEFNRFTTTNLKVRPSSRLKLQLHQLPYRSSSLHN